MADNTDFDIAHLQMAISRVTSCLIQLYGLTSKIVFKLPVDHKDYLELNAELTKLSERIQVLVDNPPGGSGRG